MPEDIPDRPYFVVPAPLRLWTREWVPSPAVSMVIDGPSGAVELRLRPDLIDTPIGGTSIQYHSRTPRAMTTTHQDCLFLGGATCYSDGTALAPGNQIDAWVRSGQGQDVVDELVHRYFAEWPADRVEPGPAEAPDSRPDEQAPPPDTERP
ncbi:hypothetical protein [Actinokineospora iranica]|uniref:Uncharacterized protein n=1 Tax=Actinokineospora iranica TaxID=1271860 RepID=A0A1G6VTE9_9PSEU|nr:hypothetical protein [Actinokineospora iranica]SDD56116.1 hypothetical protein SAMN05216174_11353 [Actinokineospora iranica]